MYELIVALGVLALAGPVWGAATPEQKCEAGKKQEAGKYAACRLKAEAKLVQQGDVERYNAALGRCQGKLETKFTKLEAAAALRGTTCPTVDDADDVAGYIDCASDAVSDGTMTGGSLTAECYANRFVDNGDGTITDNQTGLMWEKKSDDGSIHDMDDVYSWGSSIAPYPPSGTVFTVFLAALNGGAGPFTCFANFCDWRLPTNEELETILLSSYPCGTSPCVDQVFDTGCTPGCNSLSCSCMPVPNVTWSLSTVSWDPTQAYAVDLDTGQTGVVGKQYPIYARAVRGGS